MSITVTTGYHYADPAPALTVTCTSSPSLNAPLTVVRVHEDGSEHAIITPSAPRLAGGTWSGIDRHAPYNQYVTYLAESVDQTGTSSEITSLSSRVWLLSASDPSKSTVLDRVIGPMQSRSRHGRAERLDILGSSEPIHRTDSPLSVENSQMTVKCESVASFLSLDALLEDGQPLLLNAPRSQFHTRWRWIQPTDVEYPPVTGNALADFQYITITWEGTSQPDVDAFSPWTIGALKAAFPGDTIGDHKARYTTIRSVKLDVRV